MLVSVLKLKLLTRPMLQGCQLQDAGRGDASMIHMTAAGPYPGAMHLSLRVCTWNLWDGRALHSFSHPICSLHAPADPEVLSGSSVPVGDELSPLSCRSVAELTGPWASTLNPDDTLQEETGRA
jgi:hypothetical protein